MLAANVLNEMYIEHEAWLQGWAETNQQISLSNLKYQEHFIFKLTLNTIIQLSGS